MGIFGVSALMDGQEGPEVRVSTAEAGIAEATANSGRAGASVAAAAILAANTQALEEANSVRRSARRAFAWERSRRT